MSASSAYCDDPTRRDSHSAFDEQRSSLSSGASAFPSNTTATHSRRTAEHTTGQERSRRPMVKRARKVVSCQPCRASKLKCDRNRPCSSCELRGTTSECFQESRTLDSMREDAAQEIVKIRKALNSLEQFVARSGHAGTSSPEEAVVVSELPDEKNRARTPHTSSTRPGLRGRQSGGLYNGPTSISAQLAENEVFGPEPANDGVHRQWTEPVKYDLDVLQQMPEGDVVEDLLEHYFSHARWVYRLVWERSFREKWDDYKSGRSSDVLVLATCCGLLALATIFMSQRHPLREAISGLYGIEDAGKPLFDLALIAESRYHATGHSLEHLEFILLKAHYLLHATQDGEQIWELRGRMVTTAMAMGLHRDPSQWSMQPEITERRRWLWWHILCFDRWQAFLLGRPLSFSDHHFDTQLPSAQFEPNPDAPGCTHATAIALFRLGNALGGIVDDALALRPVPYANVQRHDRALVKWMADLPPSWELSEQQIAAGLRGDDLGTRRLVVQALSLRLLCSHIRMTLHRPYATRPVAQLVGPGLSPQDSAPSVEIAISSAEQILRLVGQYRKHAPDDAVSGHLAFVTFQVFSAAMFSAFQLIATPAGMYAERHRRNITDAMEVLRTTAPQERGGAVAGQAIQVLDALAVLWSDGFARQKDGPAKERKKQTVFARVRTLVFPIPAGGGTPEAPSSASSLVGNPAPPSTEAATFGLQGTIMPDMSHSGRSAHFPPGAHYPAHPPPLSVHVPDVTVRRPSYTSRLSSSSSQWSQPPPYEPLPSPQSSAMSGYVEPEHRAYDAPPPPEHLPSLGQAFPVEGELRYYPSDASMPAGMSWGAGMGIDPYEWTTFTRTMGTACPSYSSAPVTPYT